MLADFNIDAFKKFFRSGSVGGVILLGCIALSLAIENSPLRQLFNSFVNHKAGFENTYLHLNLTTLNWVNEGLMAIFFLLVGLEIKRELLYGELASVKRATLPVVAAIGGMLVPAVIFGLINYGSSTSAGWGIPMATDIAFAIVVVSALKSRIPDGLKIFLTALAIVDDLGAIIVIAVFYTAHLHTGYLLIGLVIWAIQLVFNWLQKQNIYYYVVPGVLLWYFIHLSGIDATVAGVLTAIAIPATASGKAHISPLAKLERQLNIPVNYLIVPLFALVNSNIPLSLDTLTAFASPLGFGIVGGLLVGKPLGITVASFIAVKLKAAKLPRNCSWPQLIGVSLLGGIGFTMSIFIALLSFHDAQSRADAKLIILCSSVMAALCGFIFLRLLHQKEKRFNYTEIRQTAIV